jgi:hypothetical protein
VTESLLAAEKQKEEERRRLGRRWSLRRINPRMEP